ncbi:DUF6771 family protein [Sphingomonas lenta]|uniref:Uncharacterized protein n=1 Tax=Sphingomonas lenta TaxID=1141887 RepID=A0A2A2SDQ2_9SPHN|nr:DUF6771 family protein [Sphingomonas lenta]PAX07343.1 hypothetical protein CKY28_15115 [Sphingomonas lenta]
MTITPDLIADALDGAPTWAKVALTVPSPRLREDARREVARHIHTALHGALEAERDQLRLPFEHDSIERLVALGGTDPEASVGPRRRPE